MEEKNGFKMFDSCELSNEDYHGPEYADHISGSNIAAVLEKSPAHLKYAERKESKALHFGTAMHCAILEPDVYEQEFICDISKDDYPEALTSDAAIKSWLKARGVTGYSAKKTPELIEMVRDTGEGVEIWSEIKSKFDGQAEGKTIVSKGDFEKIELMRQTITGYYPDYFKSFVPEISLVGSLDGIKVKVRLDMIYTDSNGDEWIIDLKSCQSAEPEKFGRDAHKLHYYEKMTLQHDCFAVAFGREPAGVILLAQEKEYPFIPQAYVMTVEQLAEGYENYQTGMRIINDCMERDSWPAYGGGVKELSTPGYVKLGE